MAPARDAYFFSLSIRRYVTALGALGRTARNPSDTDLPQTSPHTVAQSLSYRYDARSRGTNIRREYHEYHRVGVYVADDTHVRERSQRPSSSPQAALRPPMARIRQASIPSEPPQLHNARKRRHDRIHIAQERPPWAVLSRVEPYERCMKATLPQAPSAEPRAAAPKATRPKPFVHALQAWPLACAVHERNRMVRARGLMHGRRAAVPRERSRVRSPFSGAP